MKYTDIPKLIRDRMQLDELIFGNAYCLKHSDGTFERIDPLRVVLKSNGEYEIEGEEKKEEELIFDDDYGSFK